MSEITARIKGDASDFVRALGDARSAVRDLQAAANSAAGSISSVFSGLASAASGATKPVSSLLQTILRTGQDGSKSLAVTVENVNSIGKAARASEPKVDALSKSLLSVGRFAAQLAGLRLGAGLIQDLAQQTLEIDRARGTIATLVDDARLVDTITEKVRGVAAAAGFDAVDSIRALYEAISSGQEPAEALKIVETSAKLAKAGVAELAPTADLLTNVLNAYGISAEKAAVVSDALFKTVEKGKTTIPELASSLGKVLPIAAQANVDLTQLGGALSALTIGGISTAESVTALRSLLNNIIKPSDQAAGLAQKLGINFSTAALQTKGFVGFIGELRTKLAELRSQGEDTSRIIGTLAGDPKAITALAALTGQQFDKLVESQQTINSSFGTTEKAAAKISATFSDQLNVALETTKKEFADVGLELGTFIQKVNNAGSTIEGQKGILSTFFSTLTQGTKTGIQGLTALFDTATVKSAEAVVSIGKFKDSILGFITDVSTSRAGSIFANIFGGEDLGKAKAAFEKAGQDFGGVFRKGLEKLGFVETLTTAIKSQDVITAAKDQGEKLNEALKIKSDFAAEVRRVTDELNRSGIDVNAIRQTAAEFGLSAKEAIDRTVAPAVQGLFNPVALAAAFGDAAATAEVRFRDATARGISQGAQAGAGAAAQTVQDALAAGTKNAIPKILSGFEAERQLSFKVDAEFGKIQANVAKTIAEFESLSNVLNDKKAASQASKSIRELEEGLFRLGERASVSGRLTEDELRKLLTDFEDFNSKVLGKLDVNDFAAGIGKFYRDATKASEPPVKETGNLIKQGVDLADPPSKEISRLLKDGVDLSKLAIDSSELQLLDPVAVAQQLGGVSANFDRLVNENLAVGLRNVNGRIRTVFIETSIATSRAAERFVDEVRPGFESVAATLDRGTERLGQAFANFNGLVETTSVQTANLSAAQRAAVNQLLREREALINLSRSAPLGTIQQARLLEIARVLSALGGTSTVSGPRPQGFQAGGTVPGPARGDRVPALLEGGEFVVNSRAARANADLLNAVNRGFGGMRSQGGVRVENVTIMMGGQGGGMTGADAIADRLLRLSELGQLRSLGRRT